MQRPTALFILFFSLAFAACGFSARSALGQCASISVQPTTQKVCFFPGGVGNFPLTATGSNLTYQWQQQDLGETFPDFIDLHDGAVYDTVFGLYIWFNASGTNTNQLTLTDAQGYGQVFRCVVSGSCGQVVSSEVSLLYCHVDYDCNGRVGIDDIFAYLNTWFANETKADFDFSGDVSIDDIFIFLNAWFTGCA